MRIRIIPVAAAAALLALSGCSSHAQPDPAATPTAGEPYEGSAMVIDAGSGPSACTVILESWPPQCGDPLPITGWDWAEVDGWQESGDVRWGEYGLVGVVVDGELGITMAPRPLSSGTSPLPQDGGEILQPGHGTGPETGR